MQQRGNLDSNRIAQHQTPLTRRHVHQETACGLFCATCLAEHTGHKKNIRSTNTSVSSSAENHHLIHIYMFSSARLLVVSFVVSPLVHIITYYFWHRTYNNIDFGFICMDALRSGSENRSDTVCMSVAANTYGVRTFHSRCGRHRETRRRITYRRSIASTQVRSQWPCLYMVFVCVVVCCSLCLRVAHDGECAAVFHLRVPTYSVSK